MAEEIYKFLIENGFSSKEAKKYIRNVKKLVRLTQHRRKITEEREPEDPLGQWLDF